MSMRPNVSLSYYQKENIIIQSLKNIQAKRKKNDDKNA